MELPENVKLNPDRGYVEKLQAVMLKNGGYCPCRLQRIPENICICKEFQHLHRKFDPSPLGKPELY
jgi:hypothetical protein